jgi:hypothetical protein
VKRIVIVLLAVGSLSLAWSQDFYVGGGISLLVAVPDTPEALLLPTVQLGARVAEDLDFRMTLDSDLTVFLIGADLLYTFPLEAPAFAYVGGGLDLFIIPLFFDTTLVLPSLHPTVGLEVRLDPLGIFAEAQPQLIFLLGRQLVVKLRMGINIRF